MNEQCKKVLVLGGDSYVGWHIRDRIGPVRTLATYFEQPVPNGIYFDALTMDLADVIEDPSSISHAVILYGDTKPESCAENPDISTSLNVYSIKRVIDVLSEWNVKPLFVSSECVFDGEQGNYVETDGVNPILVYGQQKVAIETYLSNSSDEFIVTRLGKVLGARAGRGNIFTEWFESINKKETMYCATDQVFSPIHAIDVAEGITKLIDHDCTGIFHLAGLKAYSRYELLGVFIREFAKIAPINAEVVPCSIRDFDLRETRPLDLSMLPNKIVDTVDLKIGDIDKVCYEALVHILRAHDDKLD